MSLLKTFSNKIIQNEHKFVIFWLTLFFLSFTFVAYWKHINLDTALFDFGLQEQVIWNTANGRWFASSPEVNNFLGDHFSPILFPIAIIYKIFPFSITLFILQAGAIALGIYGFYKISKIHFTNSLYPIMIVILMTLYRPISGLLLFDFHEIAFAFPFLAWGLYFLEKKNVLTGIILLFLAMTAKEDVGMFVGMIGAFYLIFRKEKWGLVLLFLGASYSYLALFVLIPHFRGDIPADTLSRYSYLGDGPKGIFNNVVHHTKDLFFNFISKEKLIYLVKLFAPVFFIILTLPELIVLVGPSIGVNLLSDLPFQVRMESQYDVMVTVGIFFVFILALKKIDKIRIFYFIRPFKKSINLAFLVLFAINIFFIINHPLILTFNKIENRKDDFVNLNYIISEIPADSIIYTSNNLGGHLGNFENVYLFDPPWLAHIKEPEYILIDKKTYSGYYDFENTKEFIIKFEKGNIVLYENQKKV